MTTSDSQSRSFLSIIITIIKRYFFSGLFVFVPLSITVIIFIAVLNFTDTILKIFPKSILPYRIPGLGFILLVIIIILMGVVTTNIIGKRLMAWGDKMIGKIPLIRVVYTTAKQFMEIVMDKDSNGFKRVVLFEYPRKGIYTIGFATGETQGESVQLTKKKLLNVFFPTVPNPTTGFFIMIPEEDVIPLNMSVEQAFKIIISGGIISKKEIDMKGIIAEEAKLAK